MAKTAKATFKNSAEAVTYFVGKTFKVKAAQGTHKKGDIITVSHINYGRPVYIYTTTSSSTYLSATNLEEYPMDVKNLKETIKELKEEKIRVDNEIKSIKEKIEFMEVNNVDVFDDVEYKAFATLSLLDNPNLTKLEKAKLISSLISS